MYVSSLFECSILHYVDIIQFPYVYQSARTFLSYDFMVHEFEKYFAFLAIYKSRLYK